MDDKLMSLINHWFESNDNYKIVLSKPEKLNSKKTVAIYFSSNDIFFPDTEEEFKKTIINNDRYEWKINIVKRAQKHIYIRDLYKSWYLLGINRRLCTVESLAEFLKIESQGYDEIITVGTSSGGYAAILFGSLLRADLILAFCAQWSLYEEDIEEKVKKNKKTEFARIRQYYDIADIGDNPNVFYFVSVLSDIDLIQLKHIKKAKSVHIIKILSSNHGISVPYDTLPFLLNSKRERLARIFSCNEEFSQNKFRQMVFPWYYKFFKKISRYIKCIRNSHL